MTSRRRVHVGGVGAGIGPASHRKRPACSASSPAPPMLLVRGSRLCETAAALCGLVVRPTSRCRRRCACQRRHEIAPPRGRTRASLLTYLGWAPPRYPPRQCARSILGWRRGERKCCHHAPVKKAVPVNLSKKRGGRARERRRRRRRSERARPPSCVHVEHASQRLACHAAASRAGGVPVAAPLAFAQCEAVMRASGGAGGAGAGLCGRHT